MLDFPLTPSVGDGVYRRMRNDIIFGLLPPGERLKLERLRERYGTSVSTLREILNRLASEGFVLAEGQRGFEVTAISPENLKEVSALRTLLECHALELSFQAGDLEWEGSVVSAHHKLSQMEARMMAGEASIKQVWKRYDWEFHQALIGACGSRTLRDAHAAAFDKYLRYQMISLTFRGDTAATEHRQLLEAALARDAVRAQEILRRHIDGGVEHALASKPLSVAAGVARAGG